MKHVFALTLLALAAACFGQRFKVEDDGGTWWLAPPGGKQTFCFAVCVVDPGTAWADYNPANPSYAGFRYYPDSKAWAQDTVNRLQSWGFNTIGAWSAYRGLLDVPNNHMYMTPILHIGASAGFPWLDMWDPALLKVMDDVAKPLIEPLKQDPRVIGYFSDNELGWWRGYIFKLIWEQKTHFERARVVDFLSAEYGGDWSAFGKDFEPDGASDWDELKNQGKVWLRPGSQGIKTVVKLIGMLADRYYNICRECIKKFDPEALFLGDRYISNYYPEVAEHAGKYCDVVSTNLNPDWPDGGFVRFHLNSLEELTHRPLMITEYYMCAKENGSGDPNSSSGFPVVQTQAERARGFANTTERLARTPAVIGAHWFQYSDEPPKGRGDGENYDFGLVDVNNRPYPDLTRTAHSLDLLRDHRQAAPLPLSDSIPPAPDKWDDLNDWNRDAAFQSPIEKVARGDLYCAWKRDNLLVGLVWHEDLGDEAFYKDGKVPEADRTTVEVSLPDSNDSWKLTMNDKSGAAQGPDWKYKASGGTVSRLLLSIPAAAFKETFSPGALVHLDVRLVSESRSYETNWHVREALSK